MYTNIKKTVLLLVLVCFSLITQAASYSYAWIPSLPLYGPHNIKRLLPHGGFTATAEAVAVGRITPQDLTSFYFAFPSGTSYYTLAMLDGGVLFVNPETGNPTAGYLHASNAYSTYGYECMFSPYNVTTPYGLGGDSNGHWQVTFNP